MEEKVVTSKNALTATADAIREKIGSEDLLEWMEGSGFAEAVSAIEAGGDDSLIEFIEGRITNVNLPSLTVLRRYAFSDCSALTDVYIPNVTEIGGYCFQNCRALVRISTEKTTTLGVYAFQECDSLVELNFPNVTTVGSAAFYGCDRLELVTLPMLAADSVASLFNGCSALTDVYIPNVTAIGNYCFQNCKSLLSLDLPCVVRIISFAFRNASKLQTLVLRSETVCTLGNTDAFAGTPFASNGTGGTVYVPAALIESYKTATNWSTLYGYGTCTFAAIEGSEYE